MSRDLQNDYNRYLGTRVFGSLDGLRCLAILAVVWHHYGFRDGWTPLFLRGYLGVDLFFVISGFLITTLLLREVDGTGGLKLRAFHLRRALRLLPAYYTMLVAVVASAFLRPGASSELIKHDAPYVFFLVSNIFVAHGMLTLTWSLSVEAQFYAALPLIEKYARTWAKWLLPLLYVATCLPAFGILPSVEMPPFFRRVTFSAILLGAMLAHVLNRRDLFQRAGGLIGPRASLAAIFLVVAMAAQPGGDLSGGPRLLLHGAMVLLVASCVIREQHALRALLGLWLFRRIGEMSYGIYIYHHLAAHFALAGLGQIGTDSPTARFVAVFLASWLAAEVSHRLIETPFLRLKGRFGTQKPDPVAAQGSDPKESEFTRKAGDASH